MYPSWHKWTISEEPLNITCESTILPYTEKWIDGWQHSSVKGFVMANEKFYSIDLCAWHLV